MPAADVVETDSAYVIEVELPGVRREEVDVELNGDELVITGEVIDRKREGRCSRRTRRVCEFARCSGFPVSNRGSGIATPASRRAG